MSVGKKYSPLLRISFFAKVFLADNTSTDRVSQCHSALCLTVTHKNNNYGKE